MRKFLLSLFLFAMATVFLNHGSLLAMEVERTISVGRYPTTIVFSQSGATAYVSNWAGRTISIIDTALKDEIGRITCASDNHSRVAVTKDASYLYMTNYYGGTVVKVRLSDYACVSSFYVGPWPNGCWLSTDDNRLYARVNCPYSGANGWVAEIDTTTDPMTVKRTFPMEVAGDIVLSSDGRYLYLPSYWTPNMYKVELSSGISLTIPLPNRAGLRVLSNDDKTLCMYSSLDESIYVISTDTDEVIDTIPLAIGGMDITPHGEFLYVSLPGSEVAKVSTTTSEIVDRITIGSPDLGFVALTPDGNYLYVCDTSEDTVTIIAKLHSVIAMDIKPGSCPNPVNVKSKGVIPVAILGTGDFDVTQVDPDTVRLEGVPPLRWALADVATPVEPFIGKVDCDLDCNDLCYDGFDDLVFNFDTQEVVAALGPVEDGDCLALELTGELKVELGATPIVGEDVVIILKKGRQ